MKTLLSSTLLVLVFAANHAAAQVSLQTGGGVTQTPANSGPYISVNHQAGTTPFVTVDGGGQLDWGNSAPIQINTTPYPVLASRLYGRWNVVANHVTAKLDLTSSGFGMDTGQIMESGVWDGRPLGNGAFEIVLESSLRKTRFQAQWIVRGKVFKMVSLSSGATYVVRKYARY